MKNPLSPSMAAASQSGDDGSEISLGDIAAQLLARKWILILSTVIGTSIGVFLGQLPPDQYRAGALVNIERRSQGIELPEILVGRAFDSGSVGRIDAEAHIIRSDLILGPVVDRLNLDWRIEPIRFPVIGHMAERRARPQIPDRIMPAYTRHGDVATLDLLEVDEPLVNRSVRLVVTGEGTFEATFGRDSEPVTGKVGDTIQMVPGFRFRLSELHAGVGRVYTIWRSNKTAAIARLRGGLGVGERGRNSGLVDFIFTSGDPDLSQAAVNAVVEAYHARNLDRRSAEIDQSIAFLEAQMPGVQRQTAEAAAALATFRQNTQSAELTVGSQELLNRIIEAEAQLEELRYEEEQLARRLTANHPDYRELIERKTRLEERLEEMQTEAVDLPPLEQELLTLTQNLERLVEIERQLTSRSEQLNIIRASTVSNIEILQAANRGSLIGPDRRTPIAAGFVLGLLIGVLGVLGLNFMRRGIDDSRTIEDMGLSLFATLDKVSELHGLRPLSEKFAIAYIQTSAIVVEALRGLRTGLQFSLATAPSRSLMITSPAPNVGKSFTSLNLAIVSAQAGSRVLLIDADMRKGKLHQAFSLPRKHKGLSDFLADGASLEDVLIKDKRSSLYFLPAGSSPPNPADLLTSPTFRALMEDAPKHFDLVIVDCPPVLAVTDPGIVGQMTGMSLLVVKHLETTKPEILASQKILNNSGVMVSGVILNQFDAAASRYGHYGHKYGYYGGYKYHYNN